MKLFLAKKKNLFFILLLSSIAILSHWIWFNFSSILTYGDWYYWPNEAVKELYYSWGTWLGNLSFGSVNVQLPFNLFMLTWSLIGNLGGSYDTAVKLTFLIPISILSFISPYILSKKIAQDNFISFVAALFYATTTYGIANQLPIQFVYSLVPLLIYFFISALEKNKLVNWLIFVLIYWVGVCYEIRMMYLVSVVLTIYFLFFGFSKLKNYYKNILLSLFFVVGLNIFWFLPIALGGLSNSITTITSRGLFATELLDLPHALTLFNWLWTGGYPDKTFTQQPIIWYFWLIPFIAFSVFISSKNLFHTKEKKLIIFFSIISLLGIFLTKESARPLAHLYYWLYVHLPGFGLFREASKFYLIISVGYLGLISFSLLAMKKVFNKKNAIIFYFTALILILISLINLKPLTTGEIGGLFVARQMPRDYLLVKNNILSKRQEYFRTLWIPRAPRWGFIEDNHPRVSMVDVAYTTWGNLDKNKISSTKYTGAELMVLLLKNSYAKNLISLSSIKYIIIPVEDIANDDDFFIYYGKSRKYYIRQLDKIDYLHKVDIGTKEIVIYENYNYRPHVYATAEKETIYKDLRPMIYDLRYKFINPTEYTFSIKNVSNPFYLNFSESYHPDWKIRIGDFNWMNVLTDKNYFISDKNHLKNDASLNSYYIDPSVVCKVERCKVNKDGSYDISGTLYFAPQSYMYLGLIISGSTLIFVLSYLSFTFIKHIYERKD